MAVFANTDVSFVYNGTDLSDHVVSLDLPIDIKQLDVTTMGNTFELALAGLRSWHGVKVTLVQDYAASKTDATFGPDAITPASRVVTIKPTSASVAATNPKFTGSVYIANYKVISGKVGDVATAEVTFMAATALSRATS